MTSPAPLRVNPAGLRQLAQRCVDLASGVTPTIPAVSVSPWQESCVAASTINAAGDKAGLAMRGRMTANSNKLSTAAEQYQTMDNDGAAAFTALPRGGTWFTPLVRRGSGVDGGAAGGFGTPR